MEVAQYLQHLPFLYDLYVSAPDEKARAVCQEVFSELPQVRQLEVRVVENRGRDIAPMVCEFGRLLKQYDFICHIHTKKSTHADAAMAGWREYLFHQLLGSEKQIRKIFSRFADSSRLGIVYPQGFHRLPYWGYTWLSNRPLAREWRHRLGIADMPEGYLDFPAGSMFWARGPALEPLFDAGITLADFPEEAGQTDGTLAHCLERLLALVPKRLGFQAEVIQDTRYPSWSKWRFDQYLSRDQYQMERMISSAYVHMVGFDVFDTLIVRPVTHPETSKKIVERLASATGESGFAQLRGIAENLAGSRRSRDVNLDDIYAEYLKLSAADPGVVARLRALEEKVELGLASPRLESVALFQYAIKSGKAVVLLSDTVLPRPLIEELLADLGISGYAALYLSSEIGVRKDSGDLYREVAAREGVDISKFLMIGDDEYSDVQIPHNLKMPCCHIMRPVELARTHSRISPLLEAVNRNGDPHRQVALGLVINRLYHPVFYNPFDLAGLTRGGVSEIGYAIVGPVALGFVLWFIERAQADGIRTLYFLVREAKVLKMVYDHVAAHVPDAPESKFIDVSRRSVDVAMIKNSGDIHRIVEAASYCSETLESFVHCPYGIGLSEADLDLLKQRNAWRQSCRVEAKDCGGIPTEALNALQPLILKRARRERSGLTLYLRSIDLPSPEPVALVGVGYSAALQAGLNDIVADGLRGYYLLTSGIADTESESHQAFAKGCYGEELAGNNADIPGAPAHWSHKHMLQDLLASDNPQLICYEPVGEGQFAPRYHMQSSPERTSTELRSDIEKGAVDYVADFLALKRSVCPDLTLSLELAGQIYRAFADALSPKETKTISGLISAFHECERGGRCAKNLT